MFSSEMPAGTGVWQKAVGRGREVRRVDWQQWSLIVQAVDYLCMLVSMHLALGRLSLAGANILSFL